MTESSSPSKKILYLTFARFPSEAAHTVNIIKMCQAVKKKGHDLTLVADLRKKAEDIFDLYSVRHRFETKCIKLIDVRFLGRLLFLMRAFFVVRKERSDLFYIRDVFNAFLVRTLKRPYVFEIHEAPNTLLRRALMKRVLKNAHLRCAIFISEHLKRALEPQFGSFFPEKKWVIAHDGVDLEEFDIQVSKTKARRLLNLPQNAFLAGYTGSLFKGRGTTETILKAASFLKDFLFIIVGGEGTNLASLREKVSHLHLQNVKVVGFVPHKKIPLYLKSCDVLLMPYQQKVLHRQKKHDTASYMSPLKMFEYMASGKPIISSDIDVLREVLTDKDNALLVNPEKTEEWIKALTHLQKDQKLAEELGEKARQDVKKYTWDERVRTVFRNI